MKRSKYQQVIEMLLEKPIFDMAEAKSKGISPRMLAHFCKKGVIERVSRGLYRVVEAESNIELYFEEVVLTATTIPDGVICLISALCYYNLTDQIMREYWIAVPNKNYPPKRPHTRIIRMRNISLGKINIKLGKYSVKIFNRERTIVDAFRYLSHEVAIKALQAYLKDKGHKVDLSKLIKYSKALRINIHPYIIALTT